MNTALWILIGVFVLGGGFLVSVYNGLISLKTRAQNAAKDIDVQLKRRYELIPNIVETVKGVAKQEKGLFTEVTEARSGIVTGSLKEKVEANNALTETLKSLFAVAENYPEMKSNENYSQLQATIEDTQNQITSSQRYYNAYVQKYDERVQQFPANLVAGMFGFHEKDFEYLETTETEKQNVKVDFSEEK